MGLACSSPLAYRAHLANWLLGATQSALSDIEGERRESDDWLAAITQEVNGGGA